jgi:hypothetical protein
MHPLVFSTIRLYLLPPIWIKIFGLAKTKFQEEEL